MNSSGIKRGLAVSAVSALAVAGIPALANTASAEAGDEIVFVSAGPTLNHGAVGGEIHVKLKGVTEAELDSDLQAFNSALTGSPNSPSQTVTITDASYEYIPNGGVGDSNPNDGYAEATVLVAVDTPVDGNTANYALVVNDNNDGNVDATEARTQVSQQTSGALSKIEVAPASQSAPQNQESGDYTVTLKDAAGRTTQLDSLEVVNVTPPGTVTVSDSQFDEFELVDGSETFTATGTTVGTYTIAIDSPDYTGEQTSAQLVVTKAASLTADEIDIVTAADDWDGFGDGTDGGTTLVRVDQNTIRIDINGDPSDANGNVLLTVDGNGVTFAGQDKASYTTTLDANGDGSITITVDAATIQEGDNFVLAANGFDQTIEFDRAEAASIDGESATYFCQDDSTCTVTAVVLDQFGNPVTTGEVEASRTGAQNVDATPQRKPVGSDGTVDFTFTDTNPVDGGTDTVLFEYFVDQFDQTPDLSDSSTTIKYSATGQGSNYVISLDGENTEGATYDAGDAAIIPLTDTVADQTANPEDEDATIAITGGEPNQAVTLSVDNGALILAPGETKLSQGSSSVETTLDGAGALPAGYRVIGTKSGLVTLTVDSAGRTETAPLTVEAQDDPFTARNVTLTAPATVPFGTTQITFTAVVTDAFGNPVPGVPTGVFNKVVSGPGFYQDGDAQSDANGQIKMNVRVDSGATGDVTLTIDGTDGYGQFGAAADRLTAASATKDGEGLPASSDVASATTTVESAPEKVNAALALKGGDNGAADDSLFANAINKTEGAKVKLFRKRADGTWKWLQTGVMNAKGNYRFEDVRDFNGDKVTRYKAIVKATALTNRGVGKKKVR